MTCALYTPNKDFWALSFAPNFTNDSHIYSDYYSVELHYITKALKNKNKQKRKLDKKKTKPKKLHYAP